MSPTSYHAAPSRVRNIIVVDSSWDVKAFFLQCQENAAYAICYKDFGVVGIKKVPINE